MKILDLCKNAIHDFLLEDVLNGHESIKMVEDFLKNILK